METPRRKLDCRAAFALGDDPRWEASVIWARVVSLYESEVGGNRLWDADLEDAAIFLGVFTSAAMSRGDYAVAERELKRFFRHPDIEQLDRVSSAEFPCLLGFCALGQGREAEALSLFRSIMYSDDPQTALLARQVIRHYLDGRPAGICRALCGKGLASPAVTELVQELVSLLRDQPLRLRRFPPRASRAKLRRHLRKTYPPPPPDPDPYEHVWEEVEEWKRSYHPPRLSPRKGE